MLLISIGICMLEVSSKCNQIVNFSSLRSTVKQHYSEVHALLYFDSNQVVKWATVLIPPSIDDISPLHVGISLRSALKGTLSGSLSGTLADESWKSPLIEDKKYN